MVQVVNFPAGSQCLRNLTPGLENQSNPRSCEVSRYPDLLQTENLRCQKGQWFHGSMTRRYLARCIMQTC